MEEEAEEAEEAEEVPRRDPSEKQEPHTVMWGKTRLEQSWSHNLLSLQNHQIASVSSCLVQNKSTRSDNSKQAKVGVGGAGIYIYIYIYIYHISYIYIYIYIIYFIYIIYI